MGLFIFKSKCYLYTWKLDRVSWSWLSENRGSRPMRPERQGLQQLHRPDGTVEGHMAKNEWIIFFTMSRESDVNNANQFLWVSRVGVRIRNSECPEKVMSIMRIRISASEIYYPSKRRPKSAWSRPNSGASQCSRRPLRSSATKEAYIFIIISILNIHVFSSNSTYI